MGIQAQIAVEESTCVEKDSEKNQRKPTAPGPWCIFIHAPSSSLLVMEVAVTVTEIVEVTAERDLNSRKVSLFILRTHFSLM